MNDNEVNEYKVPEYLVIRMVYTLLEKYADSKNEKLKIFTSELIKSGKIPASKISTDYIHIGISTKTEYLSCAEICFCDYIAEDFTKEKVIITLLLTFLIILYQL